MSGRATIYPAPAGVDPSPDYSVLVDGEPVFVYRTDVGSVAIVAAAATLQVEVRPSFTFERVVVRPASRGVTTMVDAGALRFTAPAPTDDAPTLLSVELDDDIVRPLFFLVKQLETDSPDRDDPNVVYLESGRVHELGRVELGSGQTLYIEGGAVLRGNVVARDATNVTIRGHGVIDGSGHTRDNGNTERLIHLAGCDGVTVEGITLLDGRTWQVMPAGCTYVRIADVAIVSDAASDDGIDIVGCRDVVVDRVFVRTRDDCVVIKAIPDFHDRSAQSVHDVTVRNSVFWNAKWGNALEIGYETRTDQISGIVFRNCDVIRCEAERYGSGGVVTIHNGDRAVVSDVLYDDIRIEDAREKLVDFKVCFDRYSRDDERGQIRRIRLRNVRVVSGPAPVSIIQGLDADHIPEDIVFEDVSIHGTALIDATGARLVTEKARGIVFIANGDEHPL